MLQQLKWVHSMLRRDLATCQSLAADARSGAPAADLRKGVKNLQKNAPLFQLRVNCLQYCSLVHSHHGNEDANMFPAIRKAAPEMGKVVDKLESDHRVISDQLDQVEGAARMLGDGSDPEMRELLADSLDALAVTLLKHLAYEEESLAPVLARWSTWPFRH